MIMESTVVSKKLVLHWDETKYQVFLQECISGKVKTNFGSDAKTVRASKSATSLVSQTSNNNKQVSNFVQDLDCRVVSSPNSSEEMMSQHISIASEDFAPTDKKAKGFEYSQSKALVGATSCKVGTTSRDVGTTPGVLSAPCPRHGVVKKHLSYHPMIRTSSQDTPSSPWKLMTRRQRNTCYVPEFLTRIYTCRTRKANNSIFHRCSEVRENFASPELTSVRIPEYLESESWLLHNSIFRI